MKTLFGVLLAFTSSICLAAPSASPVPGIATRGTPLPSETHVVSALRRSQIEGNGADSVLSFAYDTGGCNGSLHRVGYRLTLDSTKRLTEQKLVEATIEITVTETVPSSEIVCSSLIHKDERISIRTLIRDHARELHLNLDEPATAFALRVIVTNPVSENLYFQPHL